jgi:hypothetical protein
MKQPEKQVGYGGMAFGMLFGLFWCSITFCFDGAILWPATRQLLARQYASTTGTITKSQVRADNSGDGTSYHADVHYRYQVAAQEYEGKRVRFDQIGMGERHAHEMSGRYSVNQAVTVYFDPAVPENAVLEQGIDVATFFVLLFLAPFNAIAFGIVGSALGWWRGRALSRPGAGISVRNDGFRTTVRIYTSSPALVALAAWGGAGLVSVFALLIIQMVTSLEVAVAAGWIFTFVCTLVAWFLARRNYWQFDRDALTGRIEIREPSGQISQVAAGDLEPAAYSSKTTTDSEGDTSERFPVDLKCDKLTTGESRSLQLREEYSEEAAARFVAWFNGLMFPQESPTHERGS